MLPYTTFDTVDLGFIKLHVWGMFAALGFCAAILFAAREARKRNLDSEIIYDISPWIIIGSVVGARIVFLLENPSAIAGLVDIIAVWKGGMAFHGGFFGGIMAAAIYIRRRKLNFWKLADVFAPAIALGHAIGRLGCLATGLHIGKETTSALGVMYEGRLRHPTPLYEFFALIGIFGILLLLRKKASHVHGLLFACYVALYSFARFFIEFYRADPTYYGFTVAQYIVVALFAVSAGFILLSRTATSRA